MQIQGITLREISMKLLTPFETSMDRLEVRRIILLEVNADGVIGWGECVAAEAPFYSPEYADTAWPVLRDLLWPMVKGKRFDSACEIWGLLKRVRGHNMAKACLEAAAWDAEAKQKGIPLSKLLGGTREAIASRDSIGMMDSLEDLVTTAKQARAAVELGACKIINIKMGRVGGHTMARGIHDICQQHDVPVWCGGMLETGIGRAHNIALATLPNFSLPGDVTASKRYWAED